MAVFKVFHFLVAVLQLGQAVAIPLHGKRQASAVPSFVLDYGERFYCNHSPFF